MMLFPFLAAAALARPLQAPEAPTVAPAPLQVVVRSMETGEPVEGARVLASYERLHPTWGEAWWRAEIITGADGQAVLPPSVEEAKYNRVLAVAPGFGSQMISLGSRTKGPLQMTLPPEVPLDLELVFDDGKSAAFVHVGVAFGCGHAPDAISAVSDHRGHVTIPGVSPLDEYDSFELYPVGEGVYFDDLQIEGPWEAGVRQRVVVQRGRQVKGQVIGVDGSPAAGVFVGQPTRHRGPWARTDENGRFLLWGTDPENDYVEIRSADDRWLGGREIAGRGLDVYFELWDEVGGGSPPPVFPVEVDLSKSIDLTGISSVEIEFWSPYTGLRTTASPAEDGLCKTAIEAGWYFVEVGSPGGAVERIHAGAVFVGPPDSVPTPKNRVALQVPPITERQIEIQSHDRLSVWRLETSRKKDRYRHFDDLEFHSESADEYGGHWSKIDRRWLPASDWTISVQLADKEGGPDGWLPTEVVADDGETLTLRLR